MRYLKVAAASLNQIPLDWEHNYQNILQAIHKTRLQNASVLCCPELCITGYGCEDMFLATSTNKQAISVLERLLPETQNLIVAVGLPLLYQQALYNVACLIVDGKIAGFVAKQHLAASGVYYEPRWFKSWPEQVSDKILINNQAYPIGDIIFDLNSLRIGFEICEDAWHPERTGIRLAKRNVDLILNPSASNFELGKLPIRKKLVQEGAQKFNVGYLYANLLGNEAGRIIYDGDTLIAAGKEFLVSGPRFSFQDTIVSTAVIDLQTLRQQRTFNTSERKNKNLGIVYYDFKKFPHIIENNNIIIPDTWEQSLDIKQEEFTRAVTLGLWDYLRKSKAYGFVLNLSGGADSAACACLVYLMLQLAIQELGIDAFRNKISYLLSEDQVFSLPIQFYLKKLLCCLYQRTQNNTDKTWKAALLLSEALGFPLFNLSIDPLVQNYCQLIEPIIGRSLEWETDDISLQNIQARVRGPSAWLLANIENKLLLSTSNRSEASVGYMTMDGDTCGSISPLAGIDKDFILEWLKWLEKKGPYLIGPILALKNINEQTPTAELRPVSQTQTDENDLMPYPWLDRIESLFVKNKYSPIEILQDLQQTYPEASLHRLGASVERFFLRWARNQWKRERLAPAFHVDIQDIDPKAGCRFPILSSGFKEELKIMWKYIQSLS